MDLRQLLEELGYQSYHINVLMFLFSAKKFPTAKEISAESEVPLSRVYSILIELEKLGLVRSNPGKITTYTVVDREIFLRQVGKKKFTDIEKEKERMESALQLLDKKIEIASKSPEVAIRHFLSDIDYWQAYNSEIEKMEKGDTLRIINSTRWALSFLPSEIENKQGIKSMIINDLKKQRQGMKVHHMTSPESLIATLKSDLRTKEKMVEALAQLLFYDNLPDIKKNHLITIAPEFRNLMIFIMKDSTFFEFYSPDDHTKILSAVQIRSRNIAKDFARWFDSYSEKKQDPEDDYKAFKSALLKSAKEIADIEPKTVEKMLSLMRPVYG